MQRVVTVHSHPIINSSVVYLRPQSEYRLSKAAFFSQVTLRALQKKKETLPLSCSPFLTLRFSESSVSERWGEKRDSDLLLHHITEAKEKDAYSGWPLAPWTTHYDKCVTHYDAKNILASEREAKPLKYLAGSLPASWLQSQHWHTHTLTSHTHSDRGKHAWSQPEWVVILNVSGAVMLYFCTPKLEINHLPGSVHNGFFSIGFRNIA